MINVYLLGVGALGSALDNAFKNDLEKCKEGIEFVNEPRIVRSIANMLNELISIQKDAGKMEFWAEFHQLKEKENSTIY